MFRERYCPGTLHRQTCKLKPALISYPLLISAQSTSDTQGVYVGYNEQKRLEISGATDGVYNKDLQQLNGFKVLSPINLVQEVSVNAMAFEQ